VRFLVATDLDACLLDHHTYSFDEARPALEALKARGDPIVLLSSKTLAEVAAIAAEVGTNAPLVVENGGGVAFPLEFEISPSGAALREGYRLLPLGTPWHALREALREIELTLGVEARGLADMSNAELAIHTGLTGTPLAAARAREFSEPFLLADPGRAGDFERAAEARGLRLLRGGRFWHLTGPTDKGRALEVVLDAYRSRGDRFVVVGLGDAPLDLPLLRASDRPIIVPRPDGHPDAVLASSLPDAECATFPGPRGWNDAVLTVLRGGRLQAVGLTSGDRPS
jgi:mannosyl-3-phosphoglycerate phosphatase